VNTHLNDRSLPLLLVLVVVIGVSLYFFRLTTSPAGFFVDESSVAYNAYTISQTGKDEFGNQWPLFFQAFGDYKNPVYIYLLATIFKITGPGILVARLSSAVCVLAAIGLLGLLATRLTEENRTGPVVGVLVSLSAVVTPWFFELGRVSFEVALFPFTVVLFLFLLRRTTEQSDWHWSNSIYLALAAALMTYTYSVGRLLGPLLALGVIIFATRSRWPGVLRFWALYLLTLVPLISYQRLHNSALTSRFNVVSYVREDTSVSMIGWQFLKHYLANIDPRRIFWNGDPNIYQVIHVYGQPAMLMATFVLFLLGIWLVLRDKRNDRWWWFSAYGLLVSIIPASLTLDYFHMLRLSALPVFLFLFCVPALGWLWQNKAAGRIALTMLILATLAQGFVFQSHYHKSANDPWRRHLFDADYPTKIFDAALAAGKTPIYLADAMSTPYIQAYWYSTIRRTSPGTFIRLQPGQIPPVGAAVISTEEGCAQSSVIAQVPPYTLYVSDRSRRELKPLPSGAFRAELSVAQKTLSATAGQRIEIPVTVNNQSNSLWTGCERGASINQIFVGSHWVDGKGNWIREEGRTQLPYDLAPGAHATVKFSVSAPIESGVYFLEVDLLQEGVSWFGPKGSQTVRLVIHVQ
jgi:4-amino-4-deoxy-L-arabinose transferase-like glycosyltransferase